MKKAVITSLKIGLSVAIIAWLVYKARTTVGPDGTNVFDQLRSRPKDWGLLALAWVCCAMAVLLTMIRWWYLVRALDIPFRFRDALRIGFLGYLFNLAPLGIVGGDLLKAWMIATEHREHRAKAVASVVIDRMIGLYLLFIVATIAIVSTRFWLLNDQNGYILTICRMTFVLTILGAVFILALLIPGLTEGRLSKALGRLPRIGHTVESLIDAVRMYRRKPGVLLGASLMSIGVHSFFATGVYLIARGLFGDVLSLAQHFVVMPLSAVTGVLPLPLGPFEFVLEFFYTQVPTMGFIVPTGQGLVVALGYRLICILIAAIGYGYYLSSRREVARVLREAELQQQSEPPLLVQSAPADSPQADPEYDDGPRLGKVAGTPA